jgi:hypothetical protein
LSLSTSAWILIAAGATLFNLAAMQWIIQIPEYRKKQFWMPVLGILIIGGRSLLQGHALAGTLFVYSAIIVGSPSHSPRCAAGSPVTTTGGARTRRPRPVRPRWHGSP